MSLSIFTAVAGLAVAPNTPHPLVAAIIVLCIAVGAGAAGALNMAYDADIDAIMARTRTRPIPLGRVSPADAASFGVILAALSVLTLALAANIAAAGMLAFTIFFYAVVYTRWLKRRTDQNIVIGGLAGALPPAVAWAGAADLAAWGPWALVVLIFVWTPPHFWALSLLTAKEYAKAGVPMLPVTQGPRAARRWVFIYTMVLAPTGFAPVAAGIGGYAFAAMAAVGGGVMMLLALQLLRSRAGEAGMDGDRAARRMFLGSIAYLFCLFATLLVERLVGALAASVF